MVKYPPVKLRNKDFGPRGEPVGKVFRMIWPCKSMPGMKHVIYKIAL